ncbi:predicted protein [Enterococcus gallinarum EG2]|nr:predicted protein [Enterococcus gallinarum EG2]
MGIFVCKNQSSNYQKNVCPHLQILLLKQIFYHDSIKKAKLKYQMGSLLKQCKASVFLTSHFLLS